MIKKPAIFTTVIIMIFLIQTALFGDKRSENIELYLVIDKSKSMVEEIEDVSAYINRNFIEDFLIPGDRLVLIQFYGKADLIYDHRITGDGKAGVERVISSMQADGRFTDIGNALDRLSAAVNGGERLFDRQYLILLTDGKQEAPPDSPYFSTDGSFNHRFLENTKIIQRAGWKVIIIGIGSDTIVEKLAEEIGTTYETLDFGGGDEVREIPSDEIIGRINASGFSIADGRLSLELTSEGYESERTVVIEQITYQNSAGNYSLIESPCSISIPAGSVTRADIELSSKLIRDIVPDETAGTILFKFAGDTPFLPAVFESAGPGLLARGAAASSNGANKDQKRSGEDGIKGPNWLIIIIVIVAVAGVVAFIIIRNMIFHRDEDEREPERKEEISEDS